jgi:flagellar hook assembly protein FlgD
LHPNYPNPFNPSTTVAFGVATEGRVTLKIYSIDGRLVRTLVDEARIPGTYREIWDGTSDRGTRVASGTYITRMVAPDRTQVNRMMLIK